MATPFINQEIANFIKNQCTVTGYQILIVKPNNGEKQVLKSA